MHRVLILGAGYCVPSMLKYLVNHGIFVVLASRTPSSAQKLCVGLESMTQAIQLDIESEAGMRVLEEVTPTVDIIVSMVPYAFHPKAAAIAIKHKKHFFTSSYVSDAMRALNQSAKDAGVILLNECGVNPGINHMTAMRVIHKAQANGGVITEFTEKVGGLPAPEFNNNPFGYKFSWAPRGVLLAALNSAKYLQDGKEVDVDGKVLFDNYKVDPIPELGISLEWHPNRNSIPYMTQYGIQNTCKTMIRGTYRHVGWCSKIKKLVELKYLSLEETLPKIRETASPLTYAKLMAHFTQAPAGADLKQHTAKVLGLSASDSIIEAYEWLGLFGDEVVPEAVKSPLDALCHVMKEKLAFAPDEIDMIVCRQTFTIEYPSTGKTEHATSTLIDFGIKNGDSCMSRTVGLPLAIAIRMTFEGKLSGLTGLISPTLPELYTPLLAELDSLGIKVVDASSSA